MGPAYVHLATVLIGIMDSVNHASGEDIVKILLMIILRKYVSFVLTVLQILNILNVIKTVLKDKSSHNQTW